MPPLEWDKVMAAKPDSLSEDDVDNFYEAFVKVSETFTSIDPDYVANLFTGSLLQIRQRNRNTFFLAL